MSTEKELLQILELQQHNLRGVNDAITEKEQGFVTVTHNLLQLQQMHRLQPSIIVTDQEILAGYALVMCKESAAIIPELLPLFELMEQLTYQSSPLKNRRFYVMGQVCVAAAYRGKALFDLLYHHHKEVLRHEYDMVITEVATRNTRSMRAHARVGFRVLHTYKDPLDEWAVMAWDWKL